MKDVLTFNNDHPFKIGIRSILLKHFPPSIVSEFSLIFEAEKYAAGNPMTQNIAKQRMDGMYVCEVYYNERGIEKFVCDLNSWWSKRQVEYALLNFITDKLKTGVIGKDWVETKGKVSKDITSSKFETPDSEITKYMSHNAKPKKGGRK